MTEEESGSDRSYPQGFFEPPTGSCQILLVRHGQSAPYVPGQPFPLVDGHGDPPLSPLGQQQAERVGERLAVEPISAIYVSSLTRTHQTAAPLAQRLGLAPVVEPDLREVFLGEGEGGLFREMAANDHPAVVALRANQEWGEVPGAETSAQLTARTVAAVERIAAAHPDEMVAAFCHGGVVAAVYGHALGLGPMTMNGVRNSAVNHLVVDPALDGPDRWTVRTFNDASHAGPLSADDPVT